MLRVIQLSKLYLREGIMACSRNHSNFVQDGKKILGAALNYMDVVKARNVEIPKEPLLFLKPTSSYIQPGQNIKYPQVFKKVAFEVELGVIIGKTCKNVKAEHAMSYVAGYCLALDMTAQCEMAKVRANGQPWTLGKGFDTSTPVSDFIPLECIPDPHCLQLWLKVNNEMKQNASTSNLIFNVPNLIAYASKYMTLEPNDLILTGTPDGAEPIKVGDVIDCGLGDIKKMTFKICAE